MRGRNHIIRAALESIAYQTGDVLHAMEEDTGIPLKELRVDGGASANNFLMQFQADIVGRTIRRPMIRETTALGAAYLAGLATGVWDSLEDIRSQWTLDRLYTPQMAPRPPGAAVCRLAESGQPGPGLGRMTDFAKNHLCSPPKRWYTGPAGPRVRRDFFAKEGYSMKGKVSELAAKMIDYSAGNLHDINHLMKVYGYARTIRRLRGAETTTPR